MAQLSVNDDFSVVNTSGDKGSFNVNSHGDVTISNPNRGSSGRALVPSGNNQLVLNWGNDFSGGVAINGQVQLPNLQEVPAGVTVDRVVVDAQGNLYRQD